MRWAMSWTDTVKAAALAVLAERTATASRAVADAPWSWNPHDVWLSRIKPRRERAVHAAQGKASGSTTQARQGAARHAGLSD
ncbi:MAG: hypothetical protein OEY13_09875 [Gammaproteobacteria bacterium]|nr:hypothetical protein [Gammaproteobacteria bacterium]